MKPKVHKRRVAIKLAAPNDVNGNPRRLYAAIGPGGMLTVTEEGYLGDEAARQAFGPNVVIGETVNIPPSEYNRLRKLHRR
jgi:hypothetical protein